MNGNVTLYSRSPWPADGDPIRVGAPAVPWVEPLIAALRGTAGITLVEAPAPQLAKDLATDALECALLSPLDAVSLPLSRAIPGIGVCTAGPAQCLYLLTRGDPGHSHTLAIDATLDASAGLARVLLAERYDVSPAIVSATEADAAPDKVDGMVVAGEVSPDALASFPNKLDLSEAWSDWTGLPFVHALWVGRHRAPFAQLRQILAAAVRAGVESGDLSHRGSEGVYHALGSDEMSGLRHFLELAANHGLCLEDATIDLC